MCKSCESKCYIKSLVPLQKLGIVGEKLCGIVVTLNGHDAGEWECIMNVEGYQKQTRRKINIK